MEHHGVVHHIGNPVALRLRDSVRSHDVRGMLTVRDREEGQRMNLSSLIIEE